MVEHSLRVRRNSCRLRRGDEDTLTAGANVNFVPGVGRGGPTDDVVMRVGIRLRQRHKPGELTRDHVRQAIYGMIPDLIAAQGGAPGVPGSGEAETLKLARCWPLCG